MKPIFIVLSILLILLILLIMCLLYLYTPYTPYTPLKYISVVIDGRLGNQFFEVISSWAYAKKYNMKFALASDYLKQNQNYYDNFFSSIKLETKSELHKFFRSFEEKKYEDIPDYLLAYQSYLRSRDEYLVAKGLKSPSVLGRDRYTGFFNNLSNSLDKNITQFQRYRNKAKGNIMPIALPV